MRRPGLAEWLLSLVTTPERAASTVGDLMEDGSTAGAVRFWASVLGTAIALLWRDVMASPLHMATLALYGLLLQLLLAVVMGLTLGLLYGVVTIVASVVGVLESGPQWWSSGRDVPGFVAVGAAVAGWIAVLWAQFQVGRVLAKRSPGRELAPCVATTLLGFTVPVLIVLLWDAQFPTGQPIREVMFGQSFAQSFMYQVPPLLALMAGAARVRRQRLSLPG